jgi:hypothetical protein
MHVAHVDAMPVDVSRVGLDGDLRAGWDAHAQVGVAAQEVAVAVAVEREHAVADVLVECRLRRDVVLRLAHLDLRACRHEVDVAAADFTTIDACLAATGMTKRSWLRASATVTCSAPSPGFQSRRTSRPSHAGRTCASAAIASSFAGAVRT